MSASVVFLVSTESQPVQQRGRSLNAPLSLAPIQIADFGLARVDGSPECDLSGRPVKFPIRWTAPEVFTTSKLAKTSDVWSYGILFYEIMTEGESHANNYSLGLLGGR